MNHDAAYERDFGFLLRNAKVHKVKQPSTERNYLVLERLAKLLGFKLEAEYSTFPPKFYSAVNEKYSTCLCSVLCIPERRILVVNHASDNISRPDSYIIANFYRITSIVMKSSEMHDMPKTLSGKFDSLANSLIKSYIFENALYKIFEHDDAIYDAVHRDKTLLFDFTGIHTIDELDLTLTLNGF